MADEKTEEQTKSPNYSGRQLLLFNFEEEDGVEKVDEETGAIHEPYDPSKTSIITKSQSLDTLIRRIEHGEVDLAPAFQRRPGIWTISQMSRLIESILIRIPLPVFYFDGSNDRQWVVVDGLQRLVTLKRFVIEKSLRLTGLEYLRDYEDKRYEELPRDLRRRIEETQVTLHIIQSGTPAEVKYNIFKRINTGGLTLNSQEIRHALNQGPATEMLAELAADEDFLRATDKKIASERMMDRQIVLRVLSFMVTHFNEYPDDNNMDRFLNKHIKQLNNLRAEVLSELATRFKTAMKAAYDIFGSRAFRKWATARDGRRFPINKAILEVWTVILGRQSSQKIKTLIDRREKLIEGYQKLCNDTKFLTSVTQGTNATKSVRNRFRLVEDLVDAVLSERESNDSTNTPREL